MSGSASRLRVLLIDESPTRGVIVEQALTDAGYDVVARLRVNGDVLGTMDRVQPDVVIVDMESPDRDTLENMRHITSHQPRPIVMFSEQSDSETIERAVKAGVSAYVVDGLSDHRMKPVLEVAIARFREFQALRRELHETRTRLADRKDIDRARGLLMAQRGMSEDEAYNSLRKLAMDRNVSIGEAARDVISVLQMLGR